MLMGSDSPIATMLDMLVEEPFGFTVVPRYGMGAPARAAVAAQGAGPV